MGYVDPFDFDSALDRPDSEGNLILRLTSRRRKSLAHLPSHSKFPPLLACGGAISPQPPAIDGQLDASCTNCENNGTC